MMRRLDPNLVAVLAGAGIHWFLPAGFGNYGLYVMALWLVMSVAALGMLAELVLGLVTHNLDGQLHQVDLATAHQVLGYTTLGAMTAGTVTLFF